MFHKEKRISLLEVKDQLRKLTDIEKNKVVSAVLESFVDIYSYPHYPNQEKENSERHYK